MTIVPILLVLTVQSIRNDIYIVFLVTKKPEFMRVNLVCYLSFNRPDNTNEVPSYEVGFCRVKIRLNQDEKRTEEGDDVSAHNEEVG